MSLSVNPSANYSEGTRINRTLDRLGLPDAFGDAIGAFVDAQRGDLAGAARNLFDLQSGATTGQVDNLLRGTVQCSRPAYVPRCRCAGPHLNHYGNTYTLHQPVGRRAQVGQQYGFKLGPFQCQGRITGRQYNGSFCRPIQLKNNEWLYHGRTYGSLNDIWRDRRDGRLDGNASTNFTFPRPGAGLLNPGFGSFPPVGTLPTAPWSPSPIAQSAIENIINQLFGGGDPGNPVAGGGVPGSPVNGANGAADTSDILAGGGSLEDKLLLLMSKLAKHMDSQIEEQMKKIDAEIAKQDKESKKSSSGGGGIFGKIAGAIGGIAGTAFGGPIGGMAGSALGSALGGAAGGSSSTGGGSDSQKSNLQLMQTQLQQMLERRSQMFQLFTSMFKTLHDTSMGIVRNAKA